MKSQRVRSDGQLTALAGEFLVAGELARRGLQVSVTFGNAKAIDLMAHNPASGNSYLVQVKALRGGNSEFPMKKESVNEDCIYVFVWLPDDRLKTEFFVVPGRDLRKKPDQFGRYFISYKNFPSVSLRRLRELKYADKWSIFV